MLRNFNDWMSELSVLSDVAKTVQEQPCLTHGLQSKYIFLMRTKPRISELPHIIIK